MPASPPTESQRIAKLLARAGVASRRDVERLIAAGRVAINGVTVETPATLLTSIHGVTVDGEPVGAPEPTRLFRFYKPAGTLTAARDNTGRPTIYDRLPDGLPRLMPVGRLDLNTEGLLLMTTDGEFKRRLELPATGVERTYRARAYGDIQQSQLEDLMLGIEIEGVRYGPINANLERRTGTNTWIEMTLTEGKNREVRRVLEHLGLKVSRLIRTRYGPFNLLDMVEGDVDEIKQHELVAFRKTLVNKPTSKPAPEGADPAALKAWKRDAPVPRPEPVPTGGSRYGTSRFGDAPRPMRDNYTRPRTEPDAQRSGFGGRRFDRDRPQFDRDAPRGDFAPGDRDAPRAGFGRPRDGDAPRGDRPGFRDRQARDSDAPRTGFGAPRGDRADRPRRDGGAERTPRPTGFRSHATERPVDRGDGYDPLANAGETAPPARPLRGGAVRGGPPTNRRDRFVAGGQDGDAARTNRGRRAAAFAERPGYDGAHRVGAKGPSRDRDAPSGPRRGGTLGPAPAGTGVGAGRRMTAAEASDLDRASFVEKPARGKRTGWAKAAAPARPPRGKPKGAGPKGAGPKGGAPKGRR